MLSRLKRNGDESHQSISIIDSLLYGVPDLNDFKVIVTPVPELQEGEILLRTNYFSLDPYMRGRMSGITTYVEPFALGEVIAGGAVCTVEESRNTAYCGLMKIGQPKAGETVVVSAATRGVGSIVGQLAKSLGCRVVGIAGGAQKCQYAVGELGFDACIDHRSKTMASDLRQACPKGIDIYYENVGGPIFWVVFQQLNSFARVPICSKVLWYNDLFTLQIQGKLWRKLLAFIRTFFHFDKTPRILVSAIGKRIKLQEVIVTDYYSEYEAFLTEFIPLVQSSKLTVKEDIVNGLEQAPQAFIGLVQGKNFGKLIIEVPLP